MDGGKAMSWAEISDAYQNRWVAVKDAVMDGPNIISGVVAAVKTDDEICDYEPDHLGEGLVFQRTTEGDWDGIVNSDFVIEVG